MIKSSSGKKGFISSHTLFYPGGKSVQVEKGRNQEADTGAEAIEECCSLACPPWLAQYAVLYTLGPPAQRWHCWRWTGHGLIHHQSRKHCTAQSDEGILSTEFPLHRWLKWASNNNKTKKTWSRHLAKRIPRKDGGEHEKFKEERNWTDTYQFWNFKPWGTRALNQLRVLFISCGNILFHAGNNGLHLRLWLIKSEEPVEV